MKMAILIVLLFVLTPHSAWAELKTQMVEYKDGDTVLEGYLSFDDQFEGKRPSILVFHEWMGLNDYAKMRADMLAKLGYVAFAADVYGKGVRPQNTQEAGAMATKYKIDRPLLQGRAVAALSELKNHANVDAGRIAAIGYCFGGTTALELGRSGADVKGIVSFHGGLSNPMPQDAKNIKAKVLILHGADDPFVPPQEIADFEKEMKDAAVNYTLTRYPGAMHGFTNPANKGDLPGALYNAQADKRSWKSMANFLNRVL